jgi:tripartite-type tricarboxylate transporter receptor subunit TctC
MAGHPDLEQACRREDVVRNAEHPLRDTLIFIPRQDATSSRPYPLTQARRSAILHRGPGSGSSRRVIPVGRQQQGKFVLMCRIPLVLAIALLTIPVPMHPAAAQPVADFYRGRTLQMLIGYTPGGGYDLNARVLARHIGKHIPGNPSVVAQTMAGAGSLRLANFLYNVAPKDGTAIGMVGRGMAMEPLIGSSATQYDARLFTWIGSVSDQVSLCANWHTSKVKSWQDMLTTEFTVGGEGSGSDPDMFATTIRNLFGVKIRLVSGYPGGNEINLAMERGEVDGRCGWSWSSIKITKPDWLATKSINLLVQMALHANDELKGVPLILDFARTERERQILKLVLSRQEMGWPFTAPPDLPPERAAALRAAFDATMKDPDYLAEARQRQLDVNPMTGMAIDRLIKELYATPPEAIAATRSEISERKAAP